MDNRSGVIVEQGYVGGEGYGFTEATEEEAARLQQQSKDEDKKQ